MRRAFLSLLAVVLVVGRSDGEEPGGSKPRTPLEWATDLVEHIAPENNEYAHKGEAVTWKGEHGAEGYQCHADCSGFYQHLLEQAYGWKTADFKRWLGTTRPLAHVWHDAIVEGKGFKRITLVSDLKPGDVLAVKYPPGEDNTGHVMLVAGEPKARKSTEPVISGMKQWEITVIDSSRSPHGTTDTRHNGNGKAGQGAGRGVLRLYSDDTGNITGYSWSTGRKSEFKATSERPLAAGRLDLDFKP